ncbi:MAG: hypothetical protein R2710_29805 [Acidimicrobiales bacterium]
MMGPVATLQAADTDGKVKVLKKSGDWSDFTVVSLGRPFDVDGVAMVYGYDDAGDPTAGGENAGGTTTTATAAPRRAPRQANTPPPPPRDEYEPLPEYQGGPEDEWQGEF